MKVKIIPPAIFLILFSTQISAKTVNPKPQPKEEELLLCQDEATQFGNGNGKDSVSRKCLDSIKQMAIGTKAMQESADKKSKYFGHRNMLIIDQYTETTIQTNITAGNSTELNAIRALALDEKNQEIAVLEESGDILFFSAKITGNVAPYRIIQHKELSGTSEIIIDVHRDQVIALNEKSKRILFFSRLANIHGREGHKKLNILKTFNAARMDLKNLSLDPEKGELYAYDSNANKTIVIDLKAK